jgi:transposase
MRCFAGSCRFVFNKALALQKQLHEDGEKRLGYGWFEFRRQLDYKLVFSGGWLIAVPPQNTSRTCPVCRHVGSENRKTQTEFRCVECGFNENADVIGAINIRREGLSRLACQANETARRQQEPTEALLVL